MHVTASENVEARHRPSHNPQLCSRVTGVFMRFGEKWTNIAIVILSYGTLRFNQLKREMPGVSQQMLTRTLRNLERDGMLTRTIHATVPATVEYTLTSLGFAMAERVRAVGEWALKNSAEIEAARAAYDARAPLDTAKPTP